MMEREMKYYYWLLALAALVITILSLATGEIEVATPRLSHPAYAAPAITAETLDRYLEGKGSPLAGQGQALVESGRRWNVDPRLVVAIAGAESTFGTRVCAEHNAWNWFYRDTSQCSANAFDSWEDGIERVTRGLRQVYLDRGRTTIPKIAELYTATERQIWIRNVTQFYQVELDGDPTDLTFAEPAQPPDSKPPSPTPGEVSSFGMGTYLGTGEFGQEKRVAELLAKAGVRWAREEFPWAEIEPQSGQYRWRWEDRDYDAAVDALVAQGIQIVGLLDYGPNPAWAPAELQDWLPSWRAYVRQMAQHYRGRVRYWEIQNEENSRFFWQKVDPTAPNPSPQDYTRLLSAAYDEIKRADPDAKVILGGLAGYTSDLQDPAQNYFHYLAQLHQAGAWDAFDILAVHPYREVEAVAPEQAIPRGNYDPDHRTFDPNTVQRWNLVQELSALDRMVSQFGVKPIWITELGWSTGTLQARAEQRGSTAEIVQADYLVRTYIQLMALPNLERLFWFRFRDRDLTFGLIANDYRPQEGYRAYQKMTALLEGSRFLTQVRGAGYTGAPGQDDVFEYRFQKSEQTIVVLWKVTGGDIPRSVTVSDIPALAVRVIDPAEDRTGPDAGRVVQTVNGQITLQLTERPVYVVFGIPRASRRTSAQTTWPIAPYNLGVEGQGRIRVLVDGKPALEIESDDPEIHRTQKMIWLRRGCHQVEVEYSQNYSPPHLGLSLWPRAPDFDAGPPRCEEAPPEKPTNTPDAPVRAFFEAMDRLDVDAALETVAPVPGYRRIAGWALGLYKGAMDALNWDNDFSHLQYQVLGNDGRSAKVQVAGPVIIRNTEFGSTVRELEDFQVEVPVSNFLIRWYIYINPRGILPATSE